MSVSALWSPRHLARWALTSFVLSFLLARIVVLLIMTRRMPDLFLYVGQTHVHHLNYGIFLLAAVAGGLLFTPARTARARTIAAVLYGVGLALTFDEFGMWLHLGGAYWQRSSYDAVIAIAALLALLAFAPSIKRFGLIQWMWTVLVLAALAVFAMLALEQFQKVRPELERIEQRGPQ
jgi:hypothetical protein